MIVNITIDGFIISAENNGDCFIVGTKPEFPTDLSVVTVRTEDEVYNRIYHNAELIECASVDGRYWFAFRELSTNELYRAQLDADRDMYIDLLADQEYRLCLIELGII